MYKAAKVPVLVEAGNNLNQSQEVKKKIYFIDECYVEK